MILTALIPVIVIGAFVVHWISIRSTRVPGERLVLSRGTYLGLSIQLVIFAVVTFYLFKRDNFYFILIPLGILFSWFGDFFNLQFDCVKKRMTSPIVGGIISFIVAQVFYILFFLHYAPMTQLIENGFFYILLSGFLIVPAVIFRFRVYNPQQPKPVMIWAFVYGFFLGTAAALSISAAIALGGPWIIVAAGLIIFLLSDARMGETTLYGRHPVTEYQIPWITYLLAQGLIVYGTLLIMTKSL